MESKKILASILIGVILFFSFINPVMCEECEQVFDVNAKSAMLIDGYSGKIIYEKNPHEKLPPASITKIMTLILGMEALEEGKIHLDDEIVISSNASGMGGSQVYLEQGETQKIEDIFRAICLRSANDASVALGEHIAGSEELFVKMMNEKAKELGMNDTNFENATGLPHENHHTSAYDISIMSKELLKYPKVQDWLTLWMSEIKVGKDKDIVQGLVNTNKLIRFYEGANGIKTGSTQEAGFCLSASAKRGNLQLISVVLGCDSSNIRFEESKKLLNYGFSNYDSVSIGKKGDIISTLPINKGKKEIVEIILEDDAYVLIPKGSSNKIQKEIILPKNIDAPLEKSEKVGELIIKIDGKDVDKINLITKQLVQKASLKDIIKKIFINLLTNR